mmetsp:Transcript_4010/g.7791  ORF Transcript_4010/g.7791 Transcript_4010/m.7791 type:complete len:255 (-) Transcript_4010:702-1466(-)
MVRGRRGGGRGLWDILHERHDGRAKGRGALAREPARTGAQQARGDPAPPRLALPLHASPLPHRRHEHRPRRHCGRRRDAAAAPPHSVGARLASDARGGRDGARPSARNVAAAPGRGRRRRGNTRGGGGSGGGSRARARGRPVDGGGAARSRAPPVQPLAVRADVRVHRGVLEHLLPIHPPSRSGGRHGSSGRHSSGGPGGGGGHDGGGGCGALRRARCGHGRGRGRGHGRGHGRGTAGDATSRLAGGRHPRRDP